MKKWTICLTDGSRLYVKASWYRFDGPTRSFDFYDDDDNVVAIVSRNSVDAILAGEEEIDWALRQS